MTNHNSDFLPELKFTEYYQLKSVPAMMFLIEAECCDTPADKASNIESSAKGIIFALGMTAILILLSVFQLYRSLEVTPANPEMISSRDLSASNTEATVRSKIKFNSSPSYKRMGH